MATTNDWVQPIGGKKVVWRYLKVGDQMDLDSNYGRQEVAHLKKYAVYAMRIVSVEDHAGAFSVTDFRGWDDYDLDAFAEEVAVRETLRAHALQASRPSSTVADLERKIEAAQLAVQQAGEALKVVLAAAKIAEQNNGPLQQAGASQS